MNDAEYREEVLTVLRAVLASLQGAGREKLDDPHWGRALDAAVLETRAAIKAIDAGRVERTEIRAVLGRVSSAVSGPARHVPTVMHQLRVEVAEHRVSSQQASDRSAQIKRLDAVIAAQLTLLERLERKH
jgi:hypothetical protein